MRLDAGRPRIRGLTFDNRGMGASQPAGVAVTVEQMAQDTLWLMDQASWTSAHLVGHSPGGPVAMEIADATRLSARMLWLGLPSNIGSAPSRTPRP